MDKEIVTGVLVGAALGGLLTFASKAVKKYRREVDNLGHEWSNVKADPEMTSVIYSLKAFRHADEQSYYEIGCACDQLVSLWFDVNNPNLQPEAHWAYKSFRFRTDVEKHLQELAKKVDACKKPKMKTRKGEGLMEQFNQQEQKSTNMNEFRQHADALCTIVQNYHHNIYVNIQPRLACGGNTPDYYTQ